MSTFTPPDGVWIRRVTNGWHVVARLPEDDGVFEKVYEDPPIGMGDESSGVDSGAARSLDLLICDQFDTYLRSKYRAGLVLSVQPSYSNCKDADE